MLARVRKAIVAGFGGGLSAVFGTLVISGLPTKDDVGKALGVFIVGFAVTAYATFKVPNKVTPADVNAA